MTRTRQSRHRESLQGSGSDAEAGGPPGQAETSVLGIRGVRICKFTVFLQFVCNRTTTTTTLEVLSWSFVGTCRVAKLSESPSVRAPGRGRTRRRAAASPQLHPPRCPSQVLSVTILALVLSPVASRFKTAARAGPRCRVAFL